MSQNKPAKIDVFIYVQSNGIITRNTWISIIEYRIRGNQIGAISSPFWQADFTNKLTRHLLITKPFCERGKERVKLIIEWSIGWPKALIPSTSMGWQIFLCTTHLSSPKILTFHPAPLRTQKSHSTATPPPCAHLHILLPPPPLPTASATSAAALTSKKLTPPPPDTG